MTDEHNARPRTRPRRDRPDELADASSSSREPRSSSRCAARTWSFSRSRPRSPASLASMRPLKPEELRKAIRSIWDIYAEFYQWVDPEETEEEDEEDEL